jgi:integrase
MKLKLTKAVAGALELPAGKTEEFFWDKDLDCFGVRVRAGAKRIKRVSVVQYRTKSGQQRRIVLGDVRTLDLDEARKAAKKLLAKVALDGDPQADRQAERKRAADTFGSVVELYLAAKTATLRPKTLKETTRYLKTHAKPLHRAPLHKITRRDIAARLTAISAQGGGRGLRGGPVAGQAARRALSGLFTWAMREGIVDENPVINAGHPEKPKSRERVLSTAELVEVWNATEGDDYGKIVRLLILTAQRRDEVAAMPWSELNERDGIWTIPKERTKNKCEHKIALADAAWEIIESVDKRDKRDLLFGRKGPFSGFSKAKLAIDARILEARRERAKKAGAPVDEVRPMDRWTLHDLRRTVDTMMGNELGVLPHVVEALLNHVKGGVEGVYNKAKYMPQVKTALALWADHIHAITEDGSPKVVLLRRRES